MNTLHLKYVVEIERAGSITKAAENLYMNQPNLSKTLRELEESLDIVIFKRTPKGMLPTKKGREFLAYAKNILTQLEKMENLLCDEEERPVSFDIAVPRASYIARAFTEFVASLPEERAAKIDYRETNSLRTIRDVADGENNLGVIRFHADYEGYYDNVLAEKNLVGEVVLDFEYLVLASSESPLAQSEVVDCTKLGAFIEITHGDSRVPTLQGARVPYSDDSEKKRREIAIYERGSQLELLQRIPATYMWVSPMPQETMDTFSLMQRRSNMPNNRHIDMLIYRKGQHLSPEDALFVEKLSDVVEAVGKTAP